MSNKALFTQANHTLTLIGQKEPTRDHLRRLHDGSLSDLMDAIMAGTLPDRETVRKFYGLPPIQSSEPAPEPEIVIDPIIRVDRSIHPSYPDWVKKVMHPELENTGPPEYNITEIQQWLHSGQKNGGSIKGSQIYTDLKETGDIKNHFVLRDLEEIKKKGIAFFRKYFAGKIVFAWGSVVSFHGTLLIPCLCENGDSVIFVWRWLDLVWKSLDPGLRHAS